MMIEQLSFNELVSRDQLDDMLYPTSIKEWEP